MSDYWQTIQAQALPHGYKNVYQDEDGYIIEPCPALLVQELRETLRVDRQDIKHEPPYDTRVVYADGGDPALGLEPASEASNYVKTLLPGEEFNPDAPASSTLWKKQQEI